MKKRNFFFIIGAQRCATTYLAHILDEHPEIAIAKPFKPEPKFFLRDSEFHKGLDYYELKYFSHNTVKLYGEKTTGYAESEKVALRIKSSYPECKILFMIRNPVYRALSNYFYSYHEHIETRSPEEVFLYNIPAPKYKNITLSPFDYLNRGKYFITIDSYKKYFTDKKFKILIMEKFVGNKEKIKELYDFLGVSPDFIPLSLHSKINSNNIDKVKINPLIFERLKEYYVGYNNTLKEKFSIDISSWNTVKDS